jgi:hypothetical protein
LAFPPSVGAAGVTAFDLHDPSVPVAEIIYDSLFDCSTPVGAASRRLLFESATVCIEVQVDEVRHRLEVSFQPACSADVIVQQPSGSTPATVEAPGCLSCEPFSSGLTSLQLRRDVVDGGVVRTAWLLL